MYSISIIRQDEELDEVLEEAMRLPVNVWLRNERVEVKAFYQEELKADAAGTIRAATEVEVAELRVDAIIMISSVETVTFSHLDMLVLISDLLNTIDLGYNGRDDAPVVFIKDRTMRVNPKVYKYFGMDNKVLGPIMQKLDRGPNTEMYCKTDADEPDINELSARKRMNQNTYQEVYDPEGERPLRR